MCIVDVISLIIPAPLRASTTFIVRLGYLILEGLARRTDYINSYNTYCIYKYIVIGPKRFDLKPIRLPLGSTGRQTP